MTNDRPLRFLMVGNFPRERELGVARIQIELAESLRAQGHPVEEFYYPDAFRRPPGRLTWPFLQAQSDFARRAAAFVRRNADRYDVIDTLEGSLAVEKSGLGGFRGLLVTRSAGLTSLYRQWQERWEPRTQPLKRAHPVGQFLRDVAAWRNRDLYRDSLRHADLVNLVNEPEVIHVREEMRLTNDLVMLPYGITRARREAFAAAAAPAAERLAGRRVAFVGAWQRRKGSHDFGGIVRAVAREVPGVRFLFLGTRADRATVERDLGPDLGGATVEVVPFYRSEELPALLGPAAVGVFPSYVESFGFAILEKLAAGLPTVAYRCPGPPVMLGSAPAPSLVEVGDAPALAAAVVGWLRTAPAPYAEASAACRAVAAGFDWDAVARQTVAAYAERLGRLASRV